MGMDMAPATATNPPATGMGCLLQTRYTLQYKSNLTDAIESVRWAVSRGTPWIYIMADKDRGAIVEAGATAFFGGVNSGGAPEYFAVRWDNTVIDGGTDPNNANVGQWENDPDYAVAANHFINKLLISRTGSSAIPDSIDRYNFHNTIIARELADGGTFSFDEAKSLINYQDHRPNGPDSKYANEPISNRAARRYYYGNDNLGGSRTVFDCKNRIMTTKYGKYTDDWMTVYFYGEPAFNHKPWYLFWY